MQEAQYKWWLFNGEVSDGRDVLFVEMLVLVLYIGGGEDRVNTMVWSGNGMA